jgi:Holliday junction resolvase
MSPMTRYRSGYEFERRVATALELDGYTCIAARGSKGAADLVALKPGEVLLVQVKLRDPRLPPLERATLVDLANRLLALPIVAYQPAARKPIAYRLLTGTGPLDYTPWTPDFATEPA